MDSTTTAEDVTLAQEYRPGDRVKFRFHGDEITGILGDLSPHGDGYHKVETFLTGPVPTLESLYVTDATGESNAYGITEVSKIYEPGDIVSYVYAGTRMTSGPLQGTAPGPLTDPNNGFHITRRNGSWAYGIEKAHLVSAPVPQIESFVVRKADHSVLSGLPSNTVEVTVYPTIRSAPEGDVLTVLDHGGWTITQYNVDLHGIPVDFIGKNGWWIPNEWVEGLRPTPSVTVPTPGVVEQHAWVRVQDPDDEYEEMIIGQVTSVRDTRVDLRVYADGSSSVQSFSRERVVPLAEVPAVHVMRAVSFHANEAETAQRRHRADIETIGEALISEAQEREWCGEYDSVIERINGRLSVHLPDRPPEEREYEVELTITYTHTVTVTATDEDSAGDQAVENFDSGDLRYTTPDDVTVDSVEEA